MTPYHGKRAFDLALVLLTSPIWVPLLLVVAVLVRIRLGSPVFFRQSRIGWRDREFKVIKFRTMTEAKNEAGELLPDAERLTPFGKWLRSTSLDELPELLNVLRGNMSLVGPRPLLAQYLPLYSTHHRRRHEMRPGITGLAQISGRNALAWSRRFDLDVQYIEQASISLDLGILTKTIRELVKRRGINAPGEATMPYFTGYSTPERSRTVSGTIQLRDPDRPQ